jgi:hypothetical protein
MVVRKGDIIFINNFPAAESDLSCSLHCGSASVGPKFGLVLNFNEYNDAIVLEFITIRPTDPAYNANHLIRSYEVQDTPRKNFQGLYIYPEMRQNPMCLQLKKHIVQVSSSRCQISAQLTEAARNRIITVV